MTAWMLDIAGGEIDLVAPHPAQVNWRAMIRQLCRINRYNGSGDRPISVAEHTLICVAVAARLQQPRIIPHMLLHDMHEAWIGDITTPTLNAMCLVANEQAGGLGKGADAAITVRRAVEGLKARADAAIWRAAQIDPPDEAQRQAISRIDRGALWVERRDFLYQPRPRGWGPAIEAAAVPGMPNMKKARKGDAIAIETELALTLQKHLPATRGRM